MDRNSVFNSGRKIGIKVAFIFSSLVGIPPFVGIIIAVFVVARFVFKEYFILYSD